MADEPTHELELKQDTSVVEDPDEDGPWLHGVIVHEGRLSIRTPIEVIVPGAIEWPPGKGIAIRVEHGGRAEAYAMPIRRAKTGEIWITCRATPAIVEAVKGGLDKMSIEFVALQKVHRKCPDVREVVRALVTGVTLTDEPNHRSWAVLVIRKELPTSAQEDR